MLSVDKCHFCRVVAGRTPVSVLYEDDRLLAFLHAAPITPGHALLIPRAHYPALTALPAALAAHFFTVAPRLAQALTRALDAEGWNLHAANGPCAGQIAEHCCLHLVPRWVEDGFAWGWRRQAPPTPEAAAETRRRVAAYLQRFGLDHG